MRLHMHRSGPRSLAWKWLTPFAALLLTAGGVPTAAAQESPVALAPVLKVDPGTDSPDGHTSRGCSFLFLRWC